MTAAWCSQGTIDGQHVRLGSATFCDVAHAASSDPEIWVQLGSNAATALRMQDALRPDAAMVLNRLRASGYRVEILSGNSDAAVAQAAKVLQTATWQAGMKPADKIARIEDLKRAGHKVLMVASCCLVR